MVTSDLMYAPSGNGHVAYRVIDGAGDGALDVVVVTGGTMPMEALLEDPIASRFVDGVAACGRVVVFDRCGIGLSDPPAHADGTTYARWCDELEAVVTSAGLVRPALVGNVVGAPVTILYSGRHHDAVSSLVLLEPRPLVAPEPGRLRALLAGDVDTLAYICPSRVDEPGFREWFNRAGQRGASPRMAARAYPEGTPEEIHEIEQAAARVRAPTLLLRRPANPASPPRTADPILALMPAAARLDLPGQDLVLYGEEVDALIVEVMQFLTGEGHASPPERVLAAVLYSDLVASTERATALGDRRWKQVLDRHDEIARSCVRRRGGTVVKTTGDGILAVLPSASNALRAAHELRTALAEHELDVRIGVHVGDVDRRGDDISGLAVVVAARVMNLADAGEILVTSTVVRAAIGDADQFRSRGEQALKGVSGTWHLFALDS